MAVVVVVEPVLSQEKLRALLNLPNASMHLRMMHQLTVRFAGLPAGTEA